MSRIICDRHFNGEERIVCGWDRPFNSAFVDLIDDEGEPVEEHGPVTDETLNASQVYTYLRMMNLEREVAQRAWVLLVQHKTLDYPASNVVVDLTEGFGECAA